MDPFVGEIRMFAGNFAPTGWAFCNGQLLPISQNTALFSLLGTNYGGDGRTTFGLPDLRDRSPMHQGAGPGLTPRNVGEAGGSSSVTLTTAQMPSHGHSVQSAAAPDAGQPGPISMLARTSDNSSVYHTATNLKTMSAASVQSNGSGWPHNNRQPYLGVSFIIALQGIYPPRS